ncbi:MAG: UDP-N-acetylmuramoyl-tripeptide--D-alanyl-D-alanine ligase [Cyclobacteriaceae bacterium]|nr:UDP-N-acetylmuramoyl-tripeptide--D-alanyl-D-alanine ligase [Cyclobacteriaceae bacterium]
MDNFIEFLYAKFLQSDGVSIDTRTIRPGNLFFGLRGGNFNGGEYAEKALSIGASFAVVDDPKYATDERVILVADALKALQDLAVFHRSRFKRIVFGLTGSNGKTTTKELLNVVLSKKFIVHATEGNLNNHIGVPLTLLGIHPQVELALIEMGASHVGDIHELCGFANPTHGLITNIGHAHTEHFGGIEGVLRGKSELFDHLRKHDGEVFINTLDERLLNMQKRFEHPVLYPAEDVSLVASRPYVSFVMAGKTYTTHLAGDYNFANISAAIAAGRYFGIGDDAIAEAISAYKPENMRSQVIVKETTTLILDAYNANPDSMRAALRNLSGYAGQKFAVLGDMKELQHAQEEHRKIGEFIGQSEIKGIFIGEAMRFAWEAAPGNAWFAGSAEAREYIRQLDVSQAVVLVKGSRSMRLESLKEDILKN